MHRFSVPVLALLTTTISVHAATIVKSEPPMGALKEGQAVLVDDGSCPAGQIKKVVGGNHVKVGGWKNVERERSCIPR
jgi:hypothetical protein